MQFKVNYKITSYNKENIKKVIKDNENILNIKDLYNFNGLYQINKNIKYENKNSKYIYINKIYIDDSINDVEVVINQYKNDNEFSLNKILYKNNYSFTLNIENEINTKYSLYEKIYKNIGDILYTTVEYEGLEEEILKSNVIKGYMKNKNIEILEKLQYEEFENIEKIMKYCPELTTILTNFNIVKNMEYEKAINFIKGVGLNDEEF